MGEHRRSQRAEVARAPGWGLETGLRQARPTLGDVDGDGRTDLVVATESGDVLTFLGTGDRGTPLARAEAWDGPSVSSRLAPALGDLDGDGRLDLLVSDGGARSRAYRNTGSGWEEQQSWAPSDPGSGPATPALWSGELTPDPTQPGEAEAAVVAAAGEAAAVTSSRS